ncbi:MAG: extracellular solute-binding protein [Anaerolineae bacterium]|nr:extracellular solute-binding protein [Anaerolineae bacterium]
MRPPPTTFDELAEMCQALTDRDANRAGFIFWSDGSGGAGWHYTNFAFGFGAGPDDLVRINEDGTYTATFGEGPAVEAMQFLRDLRWEYDCLPLALTTGDDLIPALPTGRSAMVMFPGDQLGRIRLDYPDQLADFGYAPMPAGPEGIRTLTGGSASMISAAASADEQEAAFVFQIWRQMNTNPEELIAGFELQNETQGAVGIPFLKIYAGEYQDALAALQEPYVVMPVDNYAAFNDAIDSGEVTLVPEPPRAQEYYVAVGAVLSQVLTDENADVAALMAQAADEFQAGVLDLLDPAPTAQ